MEGWRYAAVHMHPPSEFALFRNPEKVINFFRNLESVHRSGRDAFLRFEEIQDLTSDTVLLMVSRVKDERFNHRRRIGGTFPKNEKARVVFEQSGIFGDEVFNLENLGETKGSIARHKNLSVVSNIAARFVGLCNDYFPSRQHSTATYETLIELMQNTEMHAGAGTSQKELWWASVYRTPEKALFNFLDNGQGICETATKRVGHALLNAIGIADNGELLRDIMADKVKSRTGKFYHGRGLPLVRDRTDKGLLQNVIVISNNVVASVSEGKYTTMATEFKGTFFHWEAAISTELY